MGHAPQSLAKAAAERIRSGLSPKIIRIAAAVLAPTAKPSRRVGDVSAVSRARCRSCVVISSARVSQRRASARSVCFPDATGVSSGPGRSPAQQVTSARSVRACKGSRSTGGALTRICLSVLIAVVRALTAAISCDFELPHHLDGAVGRLGRRGGLSREHRAGGRLRVDRVRLARGSTQTPIDSIHFHDPMPRAVDRTGQADAVAAGPFNADGLDATIRLGPGEQRSIPLRIGTERVGAQADAPAIDRHRDVHVLVGIDPDNHRLRFVQVGPAVRHCRLLGLRRWLVRAGDRTVMGRSCGRPLSGHGPSGQRATE